MAGGQPAHARRRTTVGSCPSGPWSQAGSPGSGWLCLKQCKGLLFVIPPLGADSLPAFVTHLKPSCF